MYLNNQHGKELIKRNRDETDSSARKLIMYDTRYRIWNF